MRMSLAGLTLNTLNIASRNRKGYQPLQ
jgi:hypothetical protein